MSEKDLNESTLNDYANTLVTQLPDHIGEQVTDLAREFKVPLWQMVCGFMLDSYQLGRLSAFQLDPAWKDGLRGTQYVCNFCGQPFKARHINQLFCSNECGLGLTKEETPDEPVDSLASVAASDSGMGGDGDSSPADLEDDVLGLLDSTAASTVRTNPNTDLEDGIKIL